MGPREEAPHRTLWLLGMTIAARTPETDNKIDWLDVANHRKIAEKPCVILEASILGSRSMSVDLPVANEKDKLKAPETDTALGLVTLGHQSEDPSKAAWELLTWPHKKWTTSRP